MQRSIAIAQRSHIAALPCGIEWLDLKLIADRLQLNRKFSIQAAIK